MKSSFLKKNLNMLNVVIPGSSKPTGMGKQRQSQRNPQLSSFNLYKQAYQSKDDYIKSKKKCL
jgi:hypothetical protein